MSRSTPENHRLLTRRDFLKIWAAGAGLVLTACSSSGSEFGLPVPSEGLNGQSSWEIFKRDNAEKYGSLLGRANQVRAGTPGKDMEIVFYNNLSRLDEKNPDNLAYILWNYERNYGSENWGDFFAGVEPGLRAGNDLLRAKLAADDFRNGVVPQVPQEAAEVLEAFVFALPEDGGLSGSKNYSWGEEGTGDFPVVSVCPYSEVRGNEELERKLLFVLSDKVAHEAFHNKVQGASKIGGPNAAESHQAMPVFTAVVNLANGVPPLIPDTTLLTIWKLQQSGYSDPVGLMLKAAAHSSEAMVLQEEVLTLPDVGYDRAEVYRYLLEEIRPWLPFDIDNPPEEIEQYLQDSYAMSQFFNELAPVVIPFGQE